MLNKKIIMLAIFLAGLLVIGATSAADVDANDTAILSAGDNDEIVSVENDLDVLSGDQYTYNDLRNEIGSGGNVNLNKSYYRYNSSDGDNTIEIINPGVINGNGAVIDMAGSNIRVFYIPTSGVTIKNLTIKNANFTGNGGAICFDSSGTVENCNFINNTASHGGAVYFAHEGTVTNCNFTNNKAIGNYGGGAIYLVGAGNVTNCNFTNNSANQGGAIRVGDKITLKNCNFINNKAEAVGGAFSASSSSTLESNIIDCNFVNNTAYECGAAFINRGRVENCNFTNNKATGVVTLLFIGGVIFIGEGNVTNCNFVNNTASHNCGAVSIVSGSVENCNFTDNTATNGNCGAVYFMSSGNVANCNFVNNSASRDGGAVYFSDKGTVTNCNFTGNNAITGSAIYFNSILSTRTVSNSRFLNNRANAETLKVTKNDNNITITFTGKDNLLNAIYSDEDVSFTNVTYWGAKGITNTDSSTPARAYKEAGQNITVEIYDSNDNLVENVTLVTDNNGQVKYDYIKLSNGNYTYKAYHSEDRYYTYLDATGNFTLNSDWGDFNRLQSYINRADANSVLTLNRNYTFTIGLDENLTGGIVIDKPITINGNGYTINALQKARIFNVTAANVVLNNITFANANSTHTGGAILFNKIGIVENCNFTNNSAEVGGAIGFYLLSEGTVKSCNFVNNTATSDFGGGGGAVYFSSKGNVINCNFTGNKAVSDAGAVIILSGSIENCNFINNTITKDNSNGGAIWIFDCSVENCNFTDNKAYCGGAIYIKGYATVKNSNFTNNKASGEGGAIWFINYFDYILTVENCNFINNSAKSYGGAIRFNSTGAAKNCNFTNNSARSGGAVYFNESCNVTNCNFIGNNATYKGGAVYFNESCNVTNCNFGDNSANYGGAIYFTSSGSTSELMDCNFIGNNATYDGGAVYFKYSRYYSSEVLNCNFTDNRASRLGGAVYFDGNGNVENCNFVNNDAFQGGAIRCSISGTVENCSFTNNSASELAGAVLFGDNGNVVNCSFTNNVASNGGAVCFIEDGNVENCNFTGNNATAGSAIYFYNFYSSAINNVSNSCFLNNRANAESLEVTKNDNNITIIFTGNDNLLNAIYSRDDVEVAFTNVFYWSADGIANTGSSAIKPLRSNREAGQNITVGVVVNGETVLNEVYPTEENGMIVLDVSAGENYYISVRHDRDSYYTEAETIISTMKFNVNVTSQATNNRTVNITAKSNIPNEAIKGKLLFILPNGTEINANYNADGTWWAVHTFDNAGDYNVTASYVGLNNVTVNNATISIRYDASVDVNNKTLDLLIGDVFTVVATTTPEGLNVSYVSDGSGVYSVDENGKVTALRQGNATITVKVGGDGIYAENSTLVNVTVSKVPTEISVLNDTIVLAVTDEVTTGATLTPADAGNVTYSISDSSVVKVEDGNIIALAEGKAIITVGFEGDKKYLKAENKTINVTVRLKDASVDVNNRTLDLFVGDTFAIVATTVPEGLNVTFVPDNSGVVRVDEDGAVTALKEGTANIAVKVGDGKTYAFNSTTVAVSVSKIPTEITVGHVSLDLFVGDETVVAASLTPADAGNVTFKSSDESVVIVDAGGNVIANGKGQANITVSFTGDDKYAAAEKTIPVDVSLNDASVTVDKDALDLKVGERYAINATRHPDTILLEITYKSSDNSVATVDENGVVAAVGEGTATITVSVGDGEIYAENSTNVTVTVKKSTPKLTAKSKAFKDTDKAKRYAVVLKDNAGKPIKKVKVYLKVNGRIYTALTDGNGKAIFKLTKLAKKGTYNALIVYKGDSKYNKVGKKVKIAVKTTFKTVGPGSKDKTTVKKIQKALKSKGYYLSYKGHYLMIDGYYGSCTQRSVKEFQSANGLKVTGSVDYKTAKKLGII